MIGGIWLLITLVAMAAALMFESLRAFGPILYLLVAALVVGVFALWRLWRSVPRVGLPVIALVVLTAAAIVLAKSMSPTGKYAMGGCRMRGGNEEYYDEYVELSGGVIYDVIAWHRHRLGTYYKKDGQWFLQMDRNDGVLDVQKLRFSVLGFDTVIPAIEGNEGGPTDFNRRRILPFTRPHWIPEWIE